MSFRVSRRAWLAALALAIPAPAQATLTVPGLLGGPSCAHAGTAPAALPPTVMRRTVVCLLNQQRRAHGLAPLHLNRRLSVASLRHARDMVAHRYFAHESRNGAPFTARILATGYGRGHGWNLGENLAWGTNAMATPAAIVVAWMHSPEHRANILRAAFRDIGVGVTAGTPAGVAGSTYATDFGRLG